MPTMQHDNITPETVTTETKGFSIEDLVAQPTEVKTNTPTPVEQTTTQSMDGWGYDFDTDKLPVVAKPETVEITETEPTKPKVKSISEATIKSSAETVVSMLDLAQSTLCNIVIKSKFNKQFTDKEQEAILTIEEKDKAELTPVELTLQQKFDKAVRKREAVIKGVPFTDKENTNLEKIYADYFRTKQIEVSPGILVAFATISVLGNRVLDIAFD